MATEPDIEQQRADLAATVEALAAKADVSTRARVAAKEKTEELEHVVAENQTAIAGAVAGFVVVAIAIVVVRRRRAKRGVLG